MGRSNACWGVAKLSRILRRVSPGIFFFVGGEREISLIFEEKRII
jgi:hypothetical protein